MTKKATPQLLLITLLFCSKVMFAQKSKIDSLLTAVKTTIEDTVKVNIYNDLFLEYEFSDDAKAKEALNNALELSKKIDYKKGLAKTYKQFGFFAEDKGNYPEALKNYFVSLKIYQEISDQGGIGANYNGIGAIYFFQNNFPEALYYFNEGLKTYLSINNKKGIALSYNNIGSVYSRTRNYPEALKNLSNSLKIDQELNNKAGVAYSYNNIGNLYENEADGEKNETLRSKKLDQSLEYHLASLKIKKELSDQAGVASSYDNIGQVLIKKKEYQEARQYLNKAKEIALKIGYKSCLKNIYSSETKLDSTLGNFRGAYENHKLHILYRDSLDNEETRKKTIQSQMTFDFEKKEAIAAAEHKKELENQGAMAEEKSRKQKLVIAFVAAGLLLVLVFALYIFRSLRITHKQKNIIEEQKNIVEQQKKVVEHQKHLVEEHQKNIIDSITYAKRIQGALLPTENYIEKTLRRLKKS